MKIVSLLGSPHGLRGNTAGLLHHVLAGAEGEGAQSEIVVLKGNTVLPCLGCDACHKKGRCAQKDDFEALKGKIINADGLILASPNYIFNVSAQLKAFMDRCCGVIHCMQFWGKYGASVITSGGEVDESINGYIDQYLISTGIIPVGGVSAVMSAMPESGFTEEVIERARSLGRRIVQAWRTKEIPDDADRRRKDFHERIRGLIGYRAQEWPFEHQYWKEHYGI